MSNIWQIQDAKARFGELLETSLVKGPQIVTKRGVEAAVLVPIEQWRQLERTNKPSLKELLLAPEARTETLTPRFTEIVMVSESGRHVNSRAK